MNNEIRGLRILVAISIIGIVVMVFGSTRVQAKNLTHYVSQAQVSEAPDNEKSDDRDNDQLEEEITDQDDDDYATEFGTEFSKAVSKDGQDEVPAGTPAITADQAQAAALVVHPGTVIKTELDDENGQLVYSVEFAGDVDVKVDAMTGAVLGTESGQD